jgi:serine phosphatase RsbU (regulator of sigma subunit)
MSLLRPQRPRRRAAWLAVSLVLLFAAFELDYRTGTELSVSLVYLAPVGLAAWFVGRGTGLLLALLSAASWAISFVLTGEPHAGSFTLVWNALMEVGIYSALALALSGVRAGIETERRLRQELEAAYRDLDRGQRIVGDIQRSLLPRSVPDLPGYRFALHYAPSTRAGGDYYDFLPCDSRRLGLVIADASGHGTPAAVVMAMMRLLLHTTESPCASPDDMLAGVNRRLASHILQNQFVTAFCASLDPATGTLRYSSAGHDPPLVLRRSTGGIEALDAARGVPLGLFENGEYPLAEFDLAPGDTLLLYTDGLTEAMDAKGRLLGRERVQAVLARDLEAGAEQIRQSLLGEIRAHVGDAPASDDLTFVIVQRGR